MAQLKLPCICSTYTQDRNKRMSLEMTVSLPRMRQPLGRRQAHVFVCSLVLKNSR